MNESLLMKLPALIASDVRVCERSLLNAAENSLKHIWRSLKFNPEKGSESKYVSTK